jgi:hypothetical protein
LKSSAVAVAAAVALRLVIKAAVVEVADMLKKQI